jgi:hypothetical protein
MKDKKSYFIFLGLVFIFGLNGYFKVCCMDVKIIEIVSQFAMIF